MAAVSRSRSSAARLEDSSSSSSSSSDGHLPSLVSESPSQKRVRTETTVDDSGGSVQKVIQEGREVMRSSIGDRHQAGGRRLSAARGFQRNLPSHQAHVQPRRLNRMQLNKKASPQAEPAAAPYAAGDLVALVPTIVTPHHGWGGKKPLHASSASGVVINCLHREVFVEFTDRRLWLRTDEIQHEQDAGSPEDGTSSPPVTPETVGVDTSAVEQMDSPPRGQPPRRKKQPVATRRSSSKPQRAKRRSSPRLAKGPSPRSSPRSTKQSRSLPPQPRANMAAEVAVELNAAAPSTVAHSTTDAEASLLAELQQWRTVDQTQQDLEEKDTPSVVDFMRERAADTHMQQAACAALFKLAFDAPARQEIGGAGGVEAIVQAMDRHPAACTLQEEACAALGNLAHGQLENRARIVASGGAAAVVRTMTGVHRGVPNLSWKGCAALWTLAGGEPSEGCHAAIGEAGGIAAVLSTLRQHRAVEFVQEKGCGALANLALSDVQQSAILEGGGLSLVVAALRRFPGSPSVQEKGRAALWNLRATASPDRKERHAPPLSPPPPTPPSASEEPSTAAGTTDLTSAPAAANEEAMGPSPSKRPQAWADINEGTDMVCILRSVLREGAEKNSEKLGFVEVGDTVQILEEMTAPDGTVRVRLTTTAMTKGNTFAAAGGADGGGWISNGGPGKKPALICGADFLDSGGDLDGDGRVSREEFVLWHLYHMGDRPSVEAFQLFFSADTDGDGDVDPKEFAAIHSQLAKLAAEKAAAKYPRQFALFNALDADGSGSLDPAELAAQLSKQGSVAGGATPIMDVGTAGELVDALDRNADGKVDFLEFCHAWGRFDADK